MKGRICSPKYCGDETFNKIIDYPCMNTMFNTCVAQYGNDSAVVDGRNYSFNEIASDVASFRAILKNAGVEKGKNVGIYAPNSYGFIRAFFAITTLGATALLMPAQLNDMAVFGCTLKYNLAALVYDEALSANLSVLKAKNPAFKLIDSGSESEEKAEGVDVEPSDPCTIVFTGGTTGKSKGALLSHRAILRGTKNGCYGIAEVFHQRYFQILPLTHVFGLIRTMLCSFYTGSSLFVCRNNKDMFRDIAIHKPTLMVLVPALAELALNLSKQFGKNMLGPDLKSIISGAAVVSPYLVNEYGKLGVKMYPGYGLTESANLVSGNPEAARNPESVGFLYDDIETKVVDGELWLKGPNMMDGYYNEPEENATAYEDGWFKTGDLVRFDEEGFLFITGRKKEIIVLSNGENISPAELETKFNSLDCIQDSLVYASNDNGHEVLALQVLPRAAVLKAQGVTDVEGFIKEQINAINKTLPAYEQISKVIIRTEDFVRTPSMKIQRGKNGEN